MLTISTKIITQYSVRPPDLRSVFDQISDFYRLFNMCPSRIEVEDMVDKLCLDVGNCVWIDGLQRKSKVRRMVIPEIIVFLDVPDNDNQKNVEEDKYEGQDDEFASILTLFKKN